MSGATFKKVMEFTDKEYDMDRLVYCFPGREWVMSSEACDISCDHGYMWPFPFVSVLYGDKGKTFICGVKSIRGVNIKKTGCSLTISFLLKEDSDKEYVEVFEHDGRPQSSISCFREWYKKNCGELPDMDGEIKSSFHVRRLFFNDCFCKSSVIKDGKICLKEIIANDISETGGSDAVLLFDYGYDNNTGIRCGNDSPDMFDEVSAGEIKKQMEDMKSASVKGYYVYFDPYLIQQGSVWDKKYKESLEIRDKCGSPVRVWGPGQWHPCTGEKSWQIESAGYLKKALELFKAEGIYLDEVGNGTQYRCCRQDHVHEHGAQTAYEGEYVRYISDRFPDKRMMCEFAPVYDMAKYFSIVMSDTRSVLNIYRFIFPQIRFVRIINCDRPLGHSEWEINKSFFNGEGLWIDNDLSDEEWYPEEVKKLIRQQYEVLQKFSGCFSSEDVEPLFDTFSEGILANRFTYGDSTVITLLNTDTQDREIVLRDDMYKDAQILLPVKDVKTGGKGMGIRIEGHGVTAIHVHPSYLFN